MSAQIDRERLQLRAPRPHILPDGTHLNHLDTSLVLRASGLSPLGPLAINTMAFDEGNMFLLGEVATLGQKARFLKPLVA